MTNGSTSPMPSLGLHIYLYCWLTILLLGVVCFLVASALIVTPTSTDFVLLSVLAVPVLFWGVLWLSLRRCSSEGLSGMRGLLLVTAYMAVGLGGFSMVIAIPAVIVAALACLGVAAASIFRSDPTFAPRKFRGLVSAFYRYRMVQ
jgi:hypothetical protein